MKADKQFDFYEFAGIVIPGAILVAGLAQVVPQIAATIPTADMTLGELGLFVILAYAAGHLVQSVGNLLEWIWWVRRGLPSDWVRTDRGGLLSASQRTALEQQLPKKLGLHQGFAWDSVNARDWLSLTRQIYASVAAATRSARIDTFNGNYGLNRGLAAALLTVAAVVYFANHDHWRYACGLAAGALIALVRMNRFGRHYARELFVQFLQLPQPDKAPATKELIVDEH